VYPAGAVADDDAADDATQPAVAAAPAPIPASAPALAPWADDLRVVARFFLLWRGGLVLVGYLTVLLTLPWSPPVDGNPRFFQESFAARLFFHFDAGWFISIAEKGYQRGGVHLPANVAFWPAFPMAMRALSAVVGSTLWAGVVISNLALFGALLMLKRLGDTWSIPDAARRAMVFYAVFPTSFYLSVPYSDALFLFFATASFYAFRRHRYLPAALLGMLASTTRASGVFLGVAYVVGWLHRRRFRPWPLEPRVMLFALVPLGVVAFMILLHQTVDDALAFAKVEGAHGWDRRWSNPLALIFRRGYQIVDHVILRSERKNFLGTDMVDFGVILGGLALLPAVLRRLGTEALTYTGLAAVLPLTTGVTSGTARYALSLFPVFLALGAWADRPSRERPLIAIMAAILPLYMFLYMSGATNP